MKELLGHIEAAGIPAPNPIEQRWTASSSSPMSPAAAGPATPQRLPADTLHSWVGIIMYLPTEDAQQREAITNRCAFAVYCALCHSSHVQHGMSKNMLHRPPHHGMDHHMACSNRYSLQPMT